MNFCVFMFVWFLLFCATLYRLSLFIFARDLQPSIWCLCCDGKVSYYCSMVVCLRPCVWQHCISVFSYFSTCGCDALLSPLEIWAGYDGAWLRCPFVCSAPGYVPISPRFLAPCPPMLMSFPCCIFAGVIFVVKGVVTFLFHDFLLHIIH